MIQLKKNMRLLKILLWKFIIRMLFLMSRVSLRYWRRYFQMRARCGTKEMRLGVPLIWPAKICHRPRGWWSAWRIWPLFWAKIVTAWRISPLSLACFVFRNHDWAKANQWPQVSGITALSCSTHGRKLLCLKCRAWISTARTTFPRKQPPPSRAILANLQNLFGIVHGASNSMPAL